MAVASSVDAMLKKLEVQHRDFLTEIRDRTVRTLQEENIRLTDELTLQRLKLTNRISPQPQVPPLPDRLFTPPAPSLVDTAPLGTAAVTRTSVQSFHAWPAELKPMQPSPRAAVHGTNHITQQILDQNAYSRQKETKRLRRFFGLADEASFLSADCVSETLRHRRPECNLSSSEVLEIFKELCRLQVLLIPGETLHGREDRISFPTFVDLIFMPQLLANVDPLLRDDTRMLVKALHRMSVEEVIDDATRASGAANHVMVADVSTKPWETPLNISVMLVVVMNLLSMGISIDYKPNHPGWMVVESICAAIFVGEIIFKLIQLGSSEFFFGETRVWNWLDSGITLLSLVEVSISLVIYLSASEGTDVADAARATVILRILRVTRVARLVKLLRFKMLRELASMIVGILIGMPALFWVFTLFLLVVFVMGTCFRVILGPTGEQNLISQCGPPDNIEDPYDDVCKLHWMYGEEFFGTVRDSMFTTFRFMIGDFSTGAGKSLAVAFSRGYGDLFHITHCIGMISVMFGLFNVITAIFVDTIVSGLKHTDIKRKHSKQYERKFVKAKLMDLLRRIFVVRSMRTSSCTARRSSMKFVNGGRPTYYVEKDEVENMTIDEEDFFDVLDDDVVKKILDDLDVCITNPTGLYDTFDPDGTGTITVSGFVEAVMKLRGEPQKNDLISSWQALRVLNDKVDQLKLALDAKGSTSCGRVEEAPGCPVKPDILVVGY